MADNRRSKLRGLVPALNAAESLLVDLDRKIRDESANADALPHKKAPIGVLCASDCPACAPMRELIEARKNVALLQYWFRLKIVQGSQKAATNRGTAGGKASHNGAAVTRERIRKAKTDVISSGASAKKIASSIERYLAKSGQPVHHVTTIRRYTK